MENQFIVIEKYPKYSINKLGEIKNNQTGKIKKQTLVSQYLCVHIMDGSKSPLVKVHRLIAECFIPNPDRKEIVNHKNGIKTDNRIENLEWCSNRENVLHSINVLGNKRHGSFNSNSRLMEHEVLQIKKLISENVPLSEIARKYNVRHEAISKIKFNRTWKHLKYENIS